MNTDFSYDPVTAQDEATATGEIAGIFADIREVMGIPLITSIWRGLAGMGNALEITWNAARPVYQSGHTEPALARVIAKTRLPIPEALAPTQLACTGIGDSDLSAIRTIIDAYNRSNGLNLLALAALISPASGEHGVARARIIPEWNTFPALKSREEFNENTWDLIRHVNAFGAPGLDAHVATLWRHLGHWPHMLSLIHSALAPKQVDGSISMAATRMVELALEEAQLLASWRDENLALPEHTRKIVHDYVNEPTQVARMVTIGYTLARWLPSR